MAQPQRFSELPTALRVHVAGTVSVAALLAMWLAPGARWSAADGFLLAGMVLLAAAFGTAKVRLALPSQWISLDIVAISMAQVTLGAPAAVLCAAVGALAATYFNRPREQPGLKPVPPYRAIFNTAACVLAVALAGLAYEAILRVPALPAGQAMVPSLAAWAAVCFLVNSLTVARAISLSSGQPLAPLWREHCLWTAPGYFAAASIAAGMALLFGRIGLWALLPLPVIYVVYEAYREHAERLRLQQEHVGERDRITESVMASFAMAIEAKDPYTRKHIQRVQHYAVRLAESCGATESEREAVRLGALVHDVGKIAIPEHILSKPSKLSPDEYARMKTHVTIGAMILDPVRFPYPVVEAVRSHHERWDGLGYPDGRRGEEIPLGGRIIAIADMFDALTTDRPYRKAMPVREALQMVRQGSGSQFDPRLVEEFIRIHPAVSRELAQIEEAAAKEPDEDERITLPEAVFAEIAAASTEDLAAAFELSELLFGHPEDETLTRRVLERVQRIVPSMTAILYETDEGGEQLLAVSVTGIYAKNIRGMAIRMGEGIAGRCAQDQRPFLNAAALLDVGRVFDPAEHIELSAALCVPVVVGGETAAVLALYHNSYEIYNEHHLRVLTTVAGHLASAIEARRHSAQGRALTFTDPRTGLYSSRYLTQVLDHRLPAMQKAGMNLAVLMLDLNELKSLNERFGRQAGDEVLATVARLIRSCARAHDVVCRYAGDEFVIVMEDAGQAEAEEMAERVRCALGDLVFWDGIRLGCSIGVALCPEDGSSVKSLIATADVRMYQDRQRRKAEERGVDALNRIPPELSARNRE